jgi:hypothetical protein
VHSSAFLEKLGLGRRCLALGKNTTVQRFRTEGLCWVVARKVQFGNRDWNVKKPRRGKISISDKARTDPHPMASQSRSFQYSLLRNWVRKDNIRFVGKRSGRFVSFLPGRNPMGTY